MGERGARSTNRSVGISIAVAGLLLQTFAANSYAARDDSWLRILLAFSAAASLGTLFTTGRRAATLIKAACFPAMIILITALMWVWGFHRGWQWSLVLAGGAFLQIVGVASLVDPDLLKPPPPRPSPPQTPIPRPRAPQTGQKCLNPGCVGGWVICSRCQRTRRIFRTAPAPPGRWGRTRICPDCNIYGHEGQVRCPRCSNTRAT